MFFNAAKVMVCLVSAMLTGKSHTLILATIVHKYTYQGLLGKALPAQVQFDALKLGVYLYNLLLLVVIRNKKASLRLAFRVKNND